MKQKAKLTFEIEETVVLKQVGYFVPEYCPRCQETVAMVAPDLLSLMTGASEREIFKLVETDAIYFVKAPRLVACPGCYRNLMSNNPNLGHGSSTPVK